MMSTEDAGFWRTGRLDCDGNWSSCVQIELLWIKLLNPCEMISVFYIYTYIPILWRFYCGFI